MNARTHSVRGASVMVTGASGFIGSHLCGRLLHEGAQVFAVSRDHRVSDNGSLVWQRANLADSAEVRQLLQAIHPDFIFHLAGHVSGAREPSQVLPTFYSNLASTVHLLTHAAETGMSSRIVIANSSEEPLGLDHDSVPCSPYAASKWSARAYGRMFHELFATPVVMPRIFMTYGPDQKDGSKLVPYVILSLLRGETPRLTSGTRLADWIYVADVVEALLRAAVTPGIEGCSFDVGTGSLSSVRQVVEEILDITATSLQPSFGAVADRRLEQQRPADITFLTQRLGYQPTTSMREGLLQTIAWYRRQVGMVLTAH
ncbi:MAG TPA: NAD-dependent epimerase/dehydratase family protein [Terriglobales bacterium]|nr:NAD-dependent epimerase/dehydratase family protein [Terriglobales bacterium]